MGTSLAQVLGGKAGSRESVTLEIDAIRYALAHAPENERGEGLTLGMAAELLGINAVEASKRIKKALAANLIERRDVWIEAINGKTTKVVRFFPVDDK